MVANFRTYEGQARLLTAVIAAHPELRLNYKEIARHFGSDWTTSGVEHFFRPIKKNATAIQDLVSSGKDAKDFTHPTGKEPATPSAATPKTPKTPGGRKRAAPSTGKSTGSKKVKSAAAQKIVEDLTANLDDDSSDNEHPALDLTPTKPGINQQKFNEHLQRVGFQPGPPPALEPAQTTASPENDDDDDVKIVTPADVGPAFSFNTQNSSTGGWDSNDSGSMFTGNFYSGGMHKSVKYEDDDDDGAC